MKQSQVESPPPAGARMLSVGLSSRLTTILAIASGLCVANVYATQPLLDAMGASFGMQAASLGSIVALTQVGYALGLILAVPLADVVDRRRLIVGQIALSVVALLAVAIARSEVALLASLFVLGLLAVVVQ